MAALPIAKYGLEKLYLFPIYKTQAEYLTATGTPPPPFDPTRPPKYWMDPAAAQSTKRSVQYANVLAVDEHGKPAHDADGKPYMEPYLLMKDEAATVNLPTDGASSEPGADAPLVPVPLRALEPEEELIETWGGIIMVRNTSIYEDAAVSFMTSDRDLIRAIAKKLGVTV